MSTDGSIPAGGSVGVDLVPADHYDFINGSELYVRGRPAVCVRFDYPHVYWRWTDEQALAEAKAAGLSEPVEKHRSCTCTPDIFQVQASKKRRAGDDPHGLAGTQTMEDTSDEEEESEMEEARRQQHQYQQQQQQHGEDGSQTPIPDAAADAGHGDVIPSAASSGPDGAARASLMSMFARRPEKAIFSHVIDAAEEVIHAAAPQSVSIEHSSRAKFRVAKKVTAITLLECEDVEVEFLAVISTVELIRCKRCTLRCTQTAQTYQLDESVETQIAFPGFQQRVMIVSTHSTGTTLIAVPGGNPPPADGALVEEENEEKQPPPMEAEVRYEVDSFREEESAAAADADADVSSSSLEVVAAPAPEASEPILSSGASSSSVPKQYRTVWSAGAFQTELLERRTAQGYFANNA